jgi:membrane fusion protein (multidrug efflux system)
MSMPPLPVEVSPVHPQTVRDQFRALGSVESDAIIEVVSEVNAIVTSLPFQEGQAVAAGALLASLDDREIRAESDRAAAMREQAQANLERAQTLFAQNAVAQQGLDDARTAFKVADANAALARARFEKTRIRAPFGGLVGRRRVSVGAYLRSGDVITDLARVDDMKVLFAAPERYATLLKPGIAVEVTTPAVPGATFEGRVAAVDPIVNPESRTLQVVARIPNRRGLLRPGMSANISVTFAERQKALVVPDEAVFVEGQQAFVYVVGPDSTVARAAVTLGTRDSMHVEVVRGLEAGTMVVRAGHQKLFPGARVMPIPEIAEGQGAGPAAGGAPGAASGGAPRSAARGSGNQGRAGAR